MLKYMIEDIKPIIYSLFPALVLGFLFYILVGLTQGMEQIDKTSPGWFWFGSILFVVILAIYNNGRNILAKSLIYAAYELWLTPITALLYMFFSVEQASKSTGAFGAAGAGIGGFLVIIMFAVCGGFTGLVLYLMGNNILKKNVKNTIFKCRRCDGSILQENEQCPGCGRKTTLKTSASAWATVIIFGFLATLLINNNSSTVHLSKDESIIIINANKANSNNVAIQKTEVPSKNVTTKEMFNRGMKYYEDGNKLLAETWIRQAADGGYSEAQYVLFASHNYGNVLAVTVDKNEGSKWLEKAANQGHPMALSELALTYLNANDKVKGCMYLLLSVALFQNYESEMFTSKQQEQAYELVVGVLKKLVHSLTRDEVEQAKNQATTWLQDHNQNSKINVEAVLSKLRAICSIDDIEIVSFNPSNVCIGNQCIQFKFIGELRNNCNIPVGAEVQIVGRSQDGVLMDSITGWPASTQNIPPGGTVPINLRSMEYNPQIKNFEIKVIRKREW